MATAESFRTLYEILKAGAGDDGVYRGSWAALIDPVPGVSNNLNLKKVAQGLANHGLVEILPGRAAIIRLLPHQGEWPIRRPCSVGTGMAGDLLFMQPAAKKRGAARAAVSAEVLEGKRLELVAHIGECVDCSKAKNLLV